MKKYPALALGLAGAAAIVLAGCSSGGGSSTASPPPAAAPSSPAAAAPASAAAAAPSGSGALTVSITGLPADPSLSYGGAPIQFTVTLSNGTSSAYTNISPLVYVAQCSCYHGRIPGEPKGTLQIQTDTGQWNSVQFDGMGGGMDYLLSVQQFPGITLPPGATASYMLRMAFNPLSQQGSLFSAGQTSINATVVALPGHTVIGTDPAAKIPLSVITG